MEREYEYLLGLVGAWLREEAPPAGEDVDWKALLKLASIHGVTGIVGYLSGKYGLCPREDMAPELRSLYRRTVGLFTQRFHQARELDALLSREGIDHIMMKGYVLREYYPVPELRTFGDIDLVIRREDRQRCHGLMLAQGFQAKTDWEPVYTYHRGQELYEIHTELMEVDVGEGSREWFRQLWSRAAEQEAHSWRFDPEFHLLYLLVHIAKHIRGSGAGLRMYMDIGIFLRQWGDGLDWESLYRQLEELALTDFAAAVFSAVERWFGVACPALWKRLPPQVLEEFTDYTLEAGVFGHHNRETAMAELMRQESADAAGKWGLLLRRTFPPARSIESRYTYLQKNPWLLPVAWVHRLVKTRAGLTEHTREARSILGADAAAVSRLRDLMRSIGL